MPETLTWVHCDSIGFIAKAAGGKTFRDFCAVRVADNLSPRWTSSPENGTSVTVMCILVAGLNELAFRHAEAPVHPSDSHKRQYKETLPHRTHFFFGSSAKKTGLCLGIRASISGACLHCPPPKKKYYRALIIRKGFWGILYYRIVIRNPPKYW